MKTITLPLVAIALAIGCGSHVNGPHLTPAPMPEGEDWGGVYYNEVFGYAHLVVSQDNKIWGRYLWTNQSHCGEISGTIEQNVVHFQWTEQPTGQVVPTGQGSSGHGYWIYSVNKDKLGQLKGEYGLKDDETGEGKWDCLKQKNIPANPDSIKCAVAADVPATQDTWDNGQKNGNGDGTTPTTPTAEPSSTDSSTPPPPL
jgi:hypothetical protein